MQGIEGRRGEARTTGRRLAAWLALLSLVLQLWITAGHIHPEDFAAPFGSAGTEAAQASSGPAGGGTPTRLAAHDDCALCLSVQLAGHSTVPVAPTLAPPPDRSYHPTAIVRAFHLTPPSHLLFETRAPPLV
jgi:hypothetical protein